MPLTAADATVGRSDLAPCQADLIHINRCDAATTEPAPGEILEGFHGTDAVHTALRRIAFSDGEARRCGRISYHFRVFVLGRKGSRHAARPADCRGPNHRLFAMDAQRWWLQLAKTYGAAERLFDGLAILPRAHFARENL